mgnify:CR=1 FL=1
MTRIGDSTDLLKCSFCGKTQKQVAQLIAGPGVYICDECVELCNEIIDERMAEAAGGYWCRSPGARPLAVWGLQRDLMQLQGAGCALGCSAEVPNSLVRLPS